jgi:hypothetical protein
MGDDFAYFYANETYDFIDEFMKVINNLESRFEFVYSTPS